MKSVFDGLNSIKVWMKSLSDEIHFVGVIAFLREEGGPSLTVEGECENLKSDVTLR
jgi:hypothetical protein